MAKMTPEDLTAELKKICGADLAAVLQYGSTVAGDSVKTSDYNVLVVMNGVSAAGLQALSGLCSRWGKAGNPAPLFFAREQLLRSADVFPVEFSDIKQTHKMLYGQDLFADMAIDPVMLRLELEHELRTKVLLLQQNFLATGGAAKDVERLMADSISAFLTLFKAALRLYGEVPPAKKMDVLPSLARHIKFDEEIFKLVWELKAGRKPAGLSAAQLFGRYLPAVQGVTDAVDVWLQRAERGAKTGMI